jgi:hypothetical protein
MDIDGIDDLWRVSLGLGNRGGGVLHKHNCIILNIFYILAFL